MESRDAESLVRQVVHLVHGTAATLKWPLVGVVLGFPGAWDSASGRMYSVPNLPFLEGVALADLLRGRFGVEVEVDNDVNYAALGEYHFGVGRGVSDLLYLNLGSGIGSGLVVNGKLHRGAHGFAGEVGSLPVRDPSGTGFVSLESVASRHVLDKRLAEMGYEKGVVNWLSEHKGGPASDEDGIVEVLTQQCALAIASAICLVDPQLVVLGGSIGRYSEALLPRIARRVERLVGRTPEIAATGLKEDAALLGATAIGLATARRTLVERITT